uniref:Conserved oligomeric Golgi complex subunit 4 n=1 Tax=Echinostoma caproni TaxID=27848 RepID=A0A183B2J6_9TREM
LDENAKALRFADDVFFVLKNCLGRALTSGSVDGICAMLNHSRAILLDELITNNLSARVRAGFPSGWMQDAYSYMQSSVAAVSVNPVVSGVSGATSLTGSSTSSSVGGLSAVASGSGNAARQQFLITLNTIEACQTNLEKLHSHFERNLSTLCESAQKEVNLSKLLACLNELKQSVSEQLQRLLDNGIDQLTSSVVRGQAKTVLQPFTSQSYELTERMVVVRDAAAAGFDEFYELDVLIPYSSVGSHPCEYSRTASSHNCVAEIRNYVHVDLNRFHAN